jgi:hypothetical protein
VTAREQQRQLIVAGDIAAVRLGSGPLLHRLALLPGAGALPAQVVKRATPGDRDDPTTRVCRKASTRPLLHGRRARLLSAILRQRQVA